jgi:O-antigen chain-terminating methyltransferase
VLLNRFDYAAYEERCRDREWNRALLAEYLPYFQGCKQVLDVACGPGLFLELLAEHGVPALGVERNPTVVNLVRKQGWAVIEADVFAFLAESRTAYDGVFCSHLIEHLPFEHVLRLIELIIPRLEPGGTFVLVFPNPESIRMQLFGFWRDPEHVRFYHPELIEAVCTHYGLTIAFSNRQTAPFALSEYVRTGEGEPTKELVVETVSPEKSAGVRSIFRQLYRRLLQGLRLVSQGELRDLENRLRKEKDAEVRALARWTEKTTWAINRMWSWPDNALIVCRKPPVA